MPDGTAALKNLLRNEVARLRPPGSSYEHRAGTGGISTDVDDVFLHAAAGLGGGTTRSSQGKRGGGLGNRTSSVEEVGSASILLLSAVQDRKVQIPLHHVKGFALDTHGNETIIGW